MSTPDTPTPDLVALVGSRICHDLISPLGAIANGVELLTLTGGRGGDAEMALISESVASANARIRFFRIAFGAAEPGQTMARNEIASVLEDAGRSSKVKVGWHPAGEVERLEAKLAFLLIQCFETAMPFGGVVDVRAERGRWRLTGTARKLRVDERVWGVLSEKAGSVAATPAQVHFALAPVVAGRAGRRLEVELSEGRAEVAF